MIDLRSIIYEQQHIAEKDHKQSSSEVIKLISELKLIQDSIAYVRREKNSSFIPIPVAFRFLAYYLLCKKEAIGCGLEKLTELLELKRRVNVAIFDPDPILGSNSYQDYSNVKTRIEDVLVGIYFDLLVFIKSIISYPKPYITIQLENVNFQAHDSFTKELDKIMHKKLYLIIEEIDQLNRFYINKKDLNFLLSKINVEREKKTNRKTIPIQIICTYMEDLSSDDKILILNSCKNRIKSQIEKIIKISDEKKLFYRKDVAVWDSAFYSACWNEARNDFIEKNNAVG